MEFHAKPQSREVSKEGYSKTSPPTTSGPLHRPAPPRTTFAASRLSVSHLPTGAPAGAGNRAALRAPIPKIVHGPHGRHGRSVTRRRRGAGAVVKGGSRAMRDTQEVRRQCDSENSSHHRRHVGAGHHCPCRVLLAAPRAPAAASLRDLRHSVPLRHLRAAHFVRAVRGQFPHRCAERWLPNPKAFPTGAALGRGQGSRHGRMTINCPHFRVFSAFRG